MLPPWTMGDLPKPPGRGWRRWLSVIGPGVLLAGASIGSGEWLFGPAVTAQYGGTLLWLATLSIAGQVFCNLEMIRYTLYCGEPIVVGFFRSWPGPMLWTFCYAILELSHIWPFNVANAAVVVAAGILDHLPGDASCHFLGLVMSEGDLVRFLSYILFLLAFVPLLFGGTIYRMLLRIFTVKLVFTLIFLIFFAMVTVSAMNAWEVVSGLFRFGAVPLRAQTVIADRHFTLHERHGPVTYVLKGTVEKDRVDVTAFVVSQKSGAQTYKAEKEVPQEFRAQRDQMIARARTLARTGEFMVEKDDDDVALRIEGVIHEDRSWQPLRITITGKQGSRTYERLEDVPDPYQTQARALTVHQGVEEMGLVSYWHEHGRLPQLDWAMIAAFAAIAGAGGLTNTLYSSFARDKGWGMGAQVGAIPSLIGGRKIALSHVGKAFPLDEGNRSRWRGWMRYIVEDQLVVWMICNVVGMALPCMLSLEFIRHAPVSDIQVAALTAEGMAQRYQGLGPLLWFLTLLVGFLVLYPGQILSGDIIARRWTDIIWTTSARTRRLGGNQVKYVYYTILLIYAVWGLVALTYFSPLQIAKIGAVLMNVALGFSALHTLYVNRTLLPPELRPSWFMQIGTIFCGIFFLLISAIVFL
jgi:hypothetical protein